MWVPKAQIFLPPSTPLRGPVERQSAAGHGRQDDDGIAVGDARLEAVEDAHVLVVEVDVDVAVEVAVGPEQLALGIGVLGGEGTQHLAHGRAGRLHLRLAAGLRAQDWWNSDRRHRARSYWRPREASIPAAVSRRRRARSRGTDPSPTRE